ncbi:conjugal transfer protein TrbC, partial [Acinetobacter baumannii]
MDKVKNQTFKKSDWEMAQEKARKQIEIFKSVEARPNNFPNINVQKPN